MDSLGWVNTQYEPWLYFDEIQHWAYQTGEPVNEAMWMWFHVPVLALGHGEGWLWVDFFEYGNDPEWIKLETTWNPHAQDTSDVWRFNTESASGFGHGTAFAPVAEGKMFHALPLPQPITNAGTIYMRYRQMRPFSESHFGLSDKKIIPADPVSGVGGAPDSWDDLVINGRWTVDERLQLFDGQDVFRVSSEEGTYPHVGEDWCEFWITIDVPAGIFRIYARGPGMSDSAPWNQQYAYDPISLFSEEPQPAEGGRDEVRFKSQVDELRTFVMASTDNYFEGSSFEWADIYVDVTGKNLTRPRSPLCWDCGEIIFLHFLGFYPIGLDGWTDTGDWLGWVYAAEYPWVYSDKWKNWLWVCTDSGTAGGVLVYVLRY